MFDFLSKKISAIFGSVTGHGKLTQDNITQAVAQVKEALLEADVPYDIVESFTSQLASQALGAKVTSSLQPRDQFVKIVHEKLVEFLAGTSAAVAQTAAPFSFQLPSVVMVMGLQGSGKTTTTAKLAHYVLEQAKARGKTRTILFASVDYYRPAAIDQLEVLARQVGVSFYRSSQTNPVKAAQDILAHYKQHVYEMLFLDTAGRLHVDAALLDELKQINALVDPKYKLLVLDAMTGQESLKVAQSFDQAVGFNGAILTKMDSDTRGGAAFAFRYALKKPILFIGSGEKVADIEAFRPERMASRILGMGDVLTLIEKAESHIKQEEQAKMASAMMQGKMTLQDFAQQMEMLNKLGSLSSLIKYLPGLGTGQVSEENVQKGERELKKFKAIINAMTLKERYYPKILNQSRKARIAKGSGTTVAEVNLLLNRFEQSQQFAKLFKKFGNKPNMFK